jgi:hypothetical protein
MTKAARSVLRDCELALEMMDEVTDPDRMRVLWVGALALIRLVGHRLHESDGQSELYRAAIAEHWNYLQQSQDPMFWQFIKNYRDAAVKRHDTRIPEDSSFLGLVPHSNGGHLLVTFEDCLLLPLESGWREGEDARDVYRDAIDWWDFQLSEIEGKC